YIFDYCKNFEYFEINPKGAIGSTVEPIGQRLFKARLNIMSLLNAPDYKQKNQLNEQQTQKLKAVQTELCEGLRAEVAAMNKDNFIVKTELEHVEKFKTAEAWENLDDLAMGT